MQAARGSIVTGWDLFLCEGLLLLGKSYVAGRDLLLRERSIVAGCWEICCFCWGVQCCWG